MSGLPVFLCKVLCAIGSHTERYSFINSFVRSFIRSFIHSFIGGVLRGLAPVEKLAV